MSKSAQRYELAAASAIAGDVARVIAPFVVRAQVAGSIRRGRPSVGDIDIVVELPPDNPWANMQMGTALIDQLGYYATRGGDKSIHCEREGAPAIDFYLASAETWGVTLLVRTGSAGFNMFLADVGRKRLPTRRLTVSRGIVNTADVVVASRTEEACFDALGLIYVEPADREAPEFDAYIRGGEDE